MANSTTLLINNVPDSTNRSRLLAQLTRREDLTGLKGSRIRNAAQIDYSTLGKDKWIDKYPDLDHSSFGEY
tara:strand:+ start:1190 stop:1402 length:213 start_codon:yes stop_codon:yes gene_type:complete